MLRASEAIVPSQYGTNKFASQKVSHRSTSVDMCPTHLLLQGLRFGTQRDIINVVKYKEFTKNTPPAAEGEAAA